MGKGSTGAAACCGAIYGVGIFGARIVEAWGSQVQRWLEAVPMIAARMAHAWYLKLDARS